MERHMSVLTCRFFQHLFTKDEEVDPEPLMPLFENQVTP